MLTLAAGVTLTGVLGSIHAFSVFIQPLESALHAGRADVSLIYSGALICLTTAVLFGHRIFAAMSPSCLALVAGGGAALGVYIAGQSEHYWLTVFAYCVLFGGANGVGYGFALQICAQTMPRREGFAMGTVTAFYALGATVAPYFFNIGLNNGGLQTAMSGAAAVYAGAGILAAYLLHRAGVRFAGESNSHSKAEPVKHSLQAVLWLGYGSGALAGLLVIGHAAAIVQSAGGSPALAIGGTTAIAFANMLGGLSAGVLSDRVRIGVLLIGLPLASACVLFFATAGLVALTLFAVLIVVGFTYGAIIAVYPVTVLAVAGTAASSRMYGRVFTSWGFVGLLGPWLAGWLFDQTGTYSRAILLAAIASLVSAATAIFLYRNQIPKLKNHQ